MGWAIGAISAASIVFLFRYLNVIVIRNGDSIAVETNISLWPSGGTKTLVLSPHETSVSAFLSPIGDAREKTFHLRISSDQAAAREYDCGYIDKRFTIERVTIGVGNEFECR